MKGKGMDIEKLLEWLKKYDLTELTIMDGKFQVTLKKDSRQASFPHQSLLAIDEAGTPAASARDSDPPVVPDSVPETPGWHEVKAPLVGTFYRSPAPDAEPFVEEGDRVEVNDKLCILEAMKIMNEIESPVRGVVRQVSVKNGSTVEFGQVLFCIEELA
jgi:acetyl-CoA carboxylase biotin carboxyl carrier protein